MRLAKQFDDSHAVRGIDLDIHAGEFFSLLGPSGCGKTTTLRMIAGFETPTSGEILLDGADLVSVPAHRRPVNTVFQSYALFPFLDVRDNVAFGLRYQKVGKGDTRRRVDEMLELVEMSAYAGRRPGQLSGGQQQRVALARALVLRAAGAAARRAAGRAGRQAAQAPAGRAQGHPAVGRRDVRLRDPRPGGGAHDVRPARGDARRPGRAGGRTGSGVQRTAHGVRGRLPRVGERAGRRGARRTRRQPGHLPARRAPAGRASAPPVAAPAR